MVEKEQKLRQIETEGNYDIACNVLCITYMRSMGCSLGLNGLPGRW